MSDPGETLPSTSSNTQAVTIATGQPTPTIGAFVGDFRIVRKVGQGGMGVVYEAEQRQPHRAVALKVMRGALVDDNYIRLFEREMQALARLKHPGIASIYQSGRTEDGHHFFAMELVHGESLDRYVKKISPNRPLAGLDRRNLVLLFLKICDAIAYAHQRGVIHRDLKPSNIFVSQETAVTPLAVPEIKILDFGLARITEVDMLVGTMVSEAGHIYGTLPYMSPEQVRADPNEIDLRTDVYSLGVILYELVAGELPYDVRKVTPYEAARIICEEMPVSRTAPIRSMASDLRAIIWKALEKEPSKRYQTVSALAEDLSRYLHELPILAKTPSTVYHVYKLVRRHKVFVATAALIVVLLATLAATMTVQARRLAIERDRASREAETSKQVSDFMVGLFNVSDPTEARGNSITAREILEVGSRRISSDLAGQPLLQAQLMTVMGRVYQALGLFDSSQTLLQRAVDIRRANLADAHLDIAEALDLLGRARKGRGDYVGAEADIREALAMRRRLVGDKHAAVAESLNDLGTALFAKGDYAAAEPLFRDALTMRKDLLGEANDSTVDSLNDLAMTVEYLRADYPTVIRMLEDVLEHRRARSGSDHPIVAQASNNLAMAHYRARNYDAAEPLFREALALNRRLLGKHPEVSTNLNNLALLLRDKNDYEGAERLFVEALELDRTLRGPEHPETVQTIVSLAALRSAKGDYAGAERSFREALAIQRKTMAEDDFQIATTKGLLGAALTGERRYAEAESLLLPAYSTISKRFGDTHPRTQAMVGRIVRLYDTWGKKPQADAFRKRVKN